MLIDTVPGALRTRPQWVTWHHERGTKVPYNAMNGRRASSTDPATWATFEIAERAAKARRHDGVGFVFSEDDPFAGVDLDDCIDDTGTIAAWARDIVDSLHSYTEISPRARPQGLGRGAHPVKRQDRRDRALRPGALLHSDRPALRRHAARHSERQRRACRALPIPTAARTARAGHDRAEGVRRLSARVGRKEDR